MTVYITIGNSDDRLDQKTWSSFCEKVDALVDAYSDQVYGRWYSLSNAPYQNACWAINPEIDESIPLKRRLKEIARQFQQHSIAWVEGEPEFLEAG
jgi:hypothetical protein